MRTSKSKVLSSSEGVQRYWTYGSSSIVPLMKTFLFRNSIVSPGRPITRLMKSRSGSSGYLKTMTSLRWISRIGSSARSSGVAAGPKTNLFTSRWSPISRLFSIDPVGILKAWTAQVRTNSARITAMTIDSKYSRTTDFFFSGLSAIRPYLQHRQERLLGDLDASHALHALLAFLLLLEQLSLARDVAAVTLGEHILAQRLHRLAGDDPAADRRLYRHLEHLPGNQLAHLRGERTPALVGHVAVHDHGERVDRLLVHQDVELDERRLLIAGDMVVERRVSARQRLQPIVELQHDFVERQLVGDEHAIRGEILDRFLHAALFLAQLQD